MSSMELERNNQWVSGIESAISNPHRTVGLSVLLVVTTALGLFLIRLIICH